MAEDAVLTSHVLDTAAGVPARGMSVDLYRLDGGATVLLGSMVTNADGRCDEALLTLANGAPGRYRLEFGAGAYFGGEGVSSFYGDVPVDFSLTDPGGHYHVPLVVSPWGYSTYRGAPSDRTPSDTANTLQAGTKVGLEETASGSMSGAGLTTHVIDIAQGIGAADLVINVYRVRSGPGSRNHIGRRTTTGEGRTADWLIPGGQLEAGSYELEFHLGTYFKATALAMPPTPFFEVARIRFNVDDPNAHYHVPLLASPWGYTTYRGG